MKWSDEIEQITAEVAEAMAAIDRGDCGSCLGTAKCPTCEDGSDVDDCPICDGDGQCHDCMGHGTRDAQLRVSSRRQQMEGEA